MQEVKTVLSILTQSGAYLEKNGVEMPRLSAEIIISKILKMKRLNLYLEYNRPLFENELDMIRIAMIKRGKKRIPIEYIFNLAEFYGREYFVDESVLIPRIETELVVEEALKRISGVRTPKVLDMGCGSGIVSITVALERTDATVMGVDISKEALDVAIKNLGRLEVKNCQFVLSDIFEAVAVKDFDLIISNPPYIGFEEYGNLPIETLKEPKIALFSENSGYEIYERILRKANEHLNEKGVIVFEIGYKQELGIIKLFEKYKYRNIQIVKDYFLNPRIAVATK
ncbi:MAG: peptide chain release factor N(5)-glutamine methyltransferase [Fusobacteria bacterium]|nr:peptide chain release factor N(5)-glutamine methyltransferase [Fusobacteriota bacterium]